MFRTELFVYKIISNFMNEENYKHSELTEKIIHEAFYVYNTLGYGFLEKVYENALYKRLREDGLKTEIQYPISVYFEDEIIAEYSADLIVDDKVIVELKAIKELAEIHEAQLINYLKATKIEVGLLINFGPIIQIKRKIFTKQKDSVNQN